MNILHIYPKCPDTYWSFVHALWFIRKTAAYPPLGLLTVGSIISKIEPSWKQRLVDLNVGCLTDRDIDWADIVFLSAMLVQKESVKKITEQCKRKGKIVILGGPIVTSYSNKFPNIDCCCQGEAEDILPILIKDLNNDNLQIYYTTQNQPDISKTPIPLWELIDLTKYATIPIQYSRGCPYDCEFCDVIVMNGRKQRHKSTEQILKELQTLHDFGYRGSIFVVDDNFVGNKTILKQMLKELVIWQEINNYPFRLLTQTSINLARDDELMTLMAQANFYKVFIGIESPNQDSLEECNKFNNTNIDLLEAIRIIQQHGMQVMGGFIVGFDHDNRNIFDRQINFIQKSGIVTAMVGMLMALPGTKLWKRLSRTNRLLNNPTGENTDGKLDFKPFQMSGKELVDGYRKILSNIYSPKGYYERMDNFFQYYKQTLKINISDENVLEGIRIFMLSVWEIGVKSKARFEYWKMLIKTCLTKPKLVPIFVELAILGFHCEKVTKNVLDNK